jgi:predicted phosphoribosyltransferase
MGTLTVLSRSDRSFEDRAEAGRLLGKALLHLRETSPLVLGIPRGGVVVARSIAEVLDAEFDAFFSLKIGAPGNPELAVGAVAEGGGIFVSAPYVERMGLEGFVEREQSAKRAEIGRRAALVRKLRPRASPAGRTVIVTDDGVATGATVKAAIGALRREGPSRIVGAFPVGPEGAMEKLAEETDELVCLRCPGGFMAVGQFYRNFKQVEDAEVEALFR